MTDDERHITLYVNADQLETLIAAMHDVSEEGFAAMDCTREQFEDLLTKLEHAADEMNPSELED